MTSFAHLLYPSRILFLVAALAVAACGDSGRSVGSGLDTKVEDSDTAADGSADGVDTDMADTTAVDVADVSTPSPSDIGSTDTVSVVEDTSSSDVSIDDDVFGDVPAPEDVPSSGDVLEPDDVPEWSDVPATEDAPGTDDTSDLPDVSEPEDVPVLQDTSEPDTSEPPLYCDPFPAGSECGPGAACFSDYFDATVGGCLGLVGNEAGLGDSCVLGYPSTCCGGTFCQKAGVVQCACNKDPSCCTSWDEVCSSIAQKDCGLECEAWCGPGLICVGDTCAEMCESPGVSVCPEPLVCSGILHGTSPLGFGACVSPIPDLPCPQGTSPCATAPDKACCANEPYFESDGAFGGATPLVTLRTSNQPYIVYLDWDAKEAKVANLEEGAWKTTSLGPATGVPLLDPQTGYAPLTVAWETPAVTAGGVFTPSQGRFTTFLIDGPGPIRDIPVGRQPVDVAGLYVLAKGATGYYLHSWSGTAVTSVAVGPSSALDGDIEASTYGPVQSWSVLGQGGNYTLWYDTGLGPQKLTKFSSVSKTDFNWGGGKPLFVYVDAATKHIMSWQQLTPSALVVPLVEVATENMDTNTDSYGVWHSCYREGGQLYHVKKGGTPTSLGALGTGNCTISALIDGSAGIAWRSAGETDRLEYLWMPP